jgi:hypothetical protein
MFAFQKHCPKIGNELKMTNNTTVQMYNNNVRVKTIQKTIMIKNQKR